jgi:hypothetical protein
MRVESEGYECEQNRNNEKYTGEDVTGYFFYHFTKHSSFVTQKDCVCQDITGKL